MVKRFLSAIKSGLMRALHDLQAWALSLWGVFVVLVLIRAEHRLGLSRQEAKTIAWVFFLVAFTAFLLQFCLFLYELAQEGRKYSRAVSRYRRADDVSMVAYRQPTRRPRRSPFRKP